MTVTWHITTESFLAADLPSIGCVSISDFLFWLPFIGPVSDNICKVPWGPNWILNLSICNYLKKFYNSGWYRFCSISRQDVYAIQGGYRESEKIFGNMLDLSHSHFHFYSTGVYGSRWDLYQGAAEELLGQSRTYFDDNNLSAAGHLCVYSWRNHRRILVGNLLFYYFISPRAAIDSHCLND